MILENGVVRTMEPSLPLARRWRSPATASPAASGRTRRRCRRPSGSTSAGAASSPASPTHTCTSRPGRWRSGEVRLEGTRSLDEALSRVRDAAERRRPGGWLRGRGWRSGDWSPPSSRRDEALDAVAPGRAGRAAPRATRTRSGSTRRRSRGPTATSTVAGGVVERDERGEPTGVLREESAWRFRDLYVDDLGRRVRRGDARRGARSQTRAASPRSTTRTAGSARSASGSGSARRAALTLRVWQSLPPSGSRSSSRWASAAASARPLLRLGYLKAFMDGTLGSQTARMLDGSGVQITSREELAEIVRAAARAGFPVAVHAIGDLREPRGARRLRGDARRVAAARPAPAHRARAAAHGGGPRPLRGAGRRRLGAVLAPALRPRPRRPLLGGPRRAPTRSARCSTPARCS